MTSRRAWCVLTGIVAAPCLAPPPAGAQVSPDPSRLTLDRIWSAREFTPERAATGSWLPDGTATVRLEERPDGDALVAVDAVSGRERDVLVPPEGLVPEPGEAPLGVSAFERADDGSAWLLHTPEQGIWIFREGRLRRLGGADWARLSRPVLSPDGRRVAWVVAGDLYVETPATNRVVRLTHDGSATLVDGTTEGVYSGLNRGGVRWSPDGRRLAFVRFDVEGVRNFSIINYTDSLYPTLRSFPLVKPGETLPAARLGVVDPGGGAITWVDLPGAPRSHYLSDWEWAPDGASLLVRQLDRRQQDVVVFEADPVTGEVREVLREHDDAWLDLQPSDWLDGGRSFTWVSERDGWRHVYRIDTATGAATLLTPGAFDVFTVEAVDPASGWLYFIASPDDPGQRHLFRAPLDGSGDVERITPAGTRGTHAYDIAPGARRAWHTFSDADTPPTTELVSLPEHRSLRVVADNHALKEKLAALKTRPTEFFRVDVGDGVELDGWVMKPWDFDPAERYPVLFYVYGMPAGQTVLDAWGGDRYLFHQMLTQLGYVVMSVDNRGTPAPRGRDWRRVIYLRHGVLPAQDQAAAVRALEARWPWMDPGRIGIYGWSGGGNVSMNAILRHPDVYSTAMEGAGISNHRYYHAAFTERFLGLPQEHPDAYEATAPANVADSLRGNLLLIHGTGDDNVHFQNAQIMENALIAARKRFTIMPYPNRTHGLREGETTQWHLHDLYVWYLQEHMPAKRNRPSPSPFGASGR